MRRAATPSKSCMGGKKIPRRERRCDGHSERRQSADDKVNYCYEAEQRQYIPRKEAKKVTHNRKRRQQQKECRRIGPIRIIVIGRRDERRLGFGEFGRIVQQ